MILFAVDCPLIASSQVESVSLRAACNCFAVPVTRVYAVSESLRKGLISNSLSNAFREDEKTSTVDVVDTVYLIYAIGLIIFTAFFAYKLTKPRVR
jgi:hypothetical protein